MKKFPGFLGLKVHNCYHNVIFPLKSNKAEYLNHSEMFWWYYSTRLQPVYLSKVSMQPDPKWWCAMLHMHKVNFSFCRLLNLIQPMHSQILNWNFNRHSIGIVIWNIYVETEVLYKLQDRWLMVNNRTFLFYFFSFKLLILEAVYIQDELWLM